MTKNRILFGFFFFFSREVVACCKLFLHIDSSAWHAFTVHGQIYWKRQLDGVVLSQCFFLFLFHENEKLQTLNSSKKRAPEPMIQTKQFELSDLTLGLLFNYIQTNVVKKLKPESLKQWITYLLPKVLHPTMFPRGCMDQRKRKRKSFGEIGEERGGLASGLARRKSGFLHKKPEKLEAACLGFNPECMLGLRRRRPPGQLVATIRCG